MINRITLDAQKMVKQMLKILRQTLCDKHLCDQSVDTMFWGRYFGIANRNINNNKNIINKQFDAWMETMDLQNTSQHLGHQLCFTIWLYFRLNRKHNDKQWL